MQRLFLLAVFFSTLPAFADCVSEVVDLKGSGWRTRATEPMVERLKPQAATGRRITVHYTGVKKNPKRTLTEKLNALFRFSTTEKTEFKKELWGDIPYHYYLDMDGKAAEARDPRYQPDTNTHYAPNGHITIVIEGNDTDDLSSAQKTKLFQLLERLQNKYSVPTSLIGIHKHFADTSCPGPAVEAAVKEYVKTKKNFKPKTCAGGAKKSSSLPEAAEPANSSAQ